jgi:Mrp family chromosome partitioning ATPase
VPTNVSTPVWVCNICHTRFDADLATAERCEAAGLPAYLPTGDLALYYSDSGSPAERGYRLVALSPVEAIGTLASSYGAAVGHTARYEPSDIFRMDWGTRRPIWWGSDHLWPHDPAHHYLNIVNGLPGLGLHVHQNGMGTWRTGDEDEAWPLRLTGLPVAGQEAAAIRDRTARIRGRGETPVLIRPLTPEVRAVLDMLRVRLYAPTRYSRYSGADETAIAAEVTASRDGLPPGCYDPARIRWWLGQADEKALWQEAEERQVAWLAGEQVTCPIPDLVPTVRYHGTRLTRSKLIKAQREIVSATGVEWEPGVDAGSYVSHLLRKTLGVTMTDITSAEGAPEMFSAVPHRVAVTSLKGGVGKSTVAAALASALALAGKSVLLVDLNLPNPGQHVIWGLGPAETDPAARLIRGTEVAAGPGRLRVFSHAQLAPAGSLPDALIAMERAEEWLGFLSGALDIRGTDVVVLDLPPGWDAVHKAVLGSHRTGLTAEVHVTTGHPLAVQTEMLPAPGRGHHRYGTPRWLVENLSRARGLSTDGSGRVAEIRLYGTGPEAVRNLAEQAGAHYGGSLPWEPEALALGRTAEMTELAADVLAAGLSKDRAR